jgi:hypothetical protein
MGHNVDLGTFGLSSIRCKGCGEDLDISEVDIDSDVTTNNPMQFELRIQCADCGKENDFIFKVIERKE